MPVNSNPEEIRRILRAYGRQRKCLRYGDLAVKLGGSSSEGRQTVRHLNNLIKNLRAGEPCLSAIVVSKKDISRTYTSGTVDMNEQTLGGFIKSARAAGFAVPGDDRNSRLQFLRAQQEAVFEWAQRETT